MQNIKHILKRFTQRSYYKPYYKKTTAFIQRKPFTSFFIALFLLFAVIVLGNILNKPKPQPQAANITKNVSVYTIGESPKATFQGKIDKPGVIKIVALAPGIIQNIYANEGDTVGQGKQLFTLSTNYQGGNAPVLQAQIAEAQYKNVSDTFNQQNDTIKKQRDLANIQHDNFAEMQSIATQSANETNNLINANQIILDQLNQQLTASINNGAPQSTIIPQETQITQLLGAQNQLKQALRNLQEQTDSGKAPGRLADTQRDLALEQLDIQGKSLELNKEVSQLQANIAEVNAATMFPASPFAGTVERIYVRIGQQVNPGTPLAEISASDPHTSAVVDVPSNIVKNISSLDPAILYINNQTYSVRPAFIPTESTNGTLYSVLYPLPDTMNGSVSDGEYIKIDIPVGQANTSAAVPFIPLDAIYQTQDSNYLLLVKNNKAIVQQVTIGNIFGSFVEITQGLHGGDQVILDRSVVAGDRVKTQ